MKRILLMIVALVAMSGSVAAREYESNEDRTEYQQPKAYLEKEPKIFGPAMESEEGGESLPQEKNDAGNGWMGVIGNVLILYIIYRVLKSFVRFLGSGGRDKDSKAKERRRREEDEEEERRRKKKKEQRQREIDQQKRDFENRLWDDWYRNHT